MYMYSVYYRDPFPGKNNFMSSLSTELKALVTILCNDVLFATVERNKTMILTNCISVKQSNPRYNSWLPQVYHPPWLVIRVMRVKTIKQDPWLKVGSVFPSTA